MIWQILIPTIPHRHAKLLNLLEVLDAQMRPDVGVTAYRDNLEASYRQKLQALYDSAEAAYVSSLADDDSVAPDFIPRCLEAMKQGPDQVGFMVRYTEKGVPQRSVIHSLSCKGWYATPLQICRDIMYYNPVRLDLARQVRFRGEYCDEDWAKDLRDLGCIQSEVFISDEMLYYQRDSSDYFLTPRRPFPAGNIPPRPEYPWLRYLENMCESS